MDPQGYEEIPSFSTIGAFLFVSLILEVFYFAIFLKTLNAKFLIGWSVQIAMVLIEIAGAHLGEIENYKFFLKTTQRIGQEKKP